MKSAFAGACTHAQKTIVLALALIASPASARQDLTPAQQNAYNAVAFAPTEAEKQIDAAKVLQTKGDMDGACKTWMAARNALNITIEQQKIASQNGFTISDDAETKAQQATALEKFNTIVLPGMQASCFVPGIWAYQKQLSGPNQYNVNQIISGGPAVPLVGGHAQGGYATRQEAIDAVKSIPGLKAIFYIAMNNTKPGYIVHFATAYDVDQAMVDTIRKSGAIDPPKMTVAHPTFATAHLNDDGYEYVRNVVPSQGLILEQIIGEDGSNLLGNGLRVDHPSASTGYLRKLFRIEYVAQRWKQAKLVYERFVLGSAAAATSAPVVKTRIEMLGELAKSKQPEMITFIKAEIKKHKIPAKDAAAILAVK